jgi:hypothetical protein
MHQHRQSKGSRLPQTWKADAQQHSRSSHLEFSAKLFEGGLISIDESDSLWWQDQEGKRRNLTPDEAAKFLHDVLDHLLKDSSKIMIPECDVHDLFLLDRSDEHLSYSLLKTPFNRIYWHIDLINPDHVFITEVEELAIGSDALWYTRQEGHEFAEPFRLMDTFRRLLKIASTVSHDQEDEYLTELFQEEAAYFEEHGCYPPDF